MSRIIDLWFVESWDSKLHTEMILTYPAESGEDSGVEVGVEGPVELQQEVEEDPLHCGSDLERDDGVQIDTEELGGVEEEVEVHGEEEVELHSEEEVELHTEEEVEVDNEEEVDTEDEAHIIVEENLEEVGDLGIALDNSDSKYRISDQQKGLVPAIQELLPRQNKNFASCTFMLTLGKDFLVRY